MEIASQHWVMVTALRNFHETYFSNPVAEKSSYGMIQSYQKQEAKYMEVSEMRFAVKNRQKSVTAYQLGKGTEMERKLIELGAIRQHPDGSYELFSQEAVNGRGEAAQPLDYFKVDEKQGLYYPYPISRDYFESNHRHVSGNEYVQIPQPLQIWECGDEVSEEIRFLLDTGKMTINEDDPERYFNAFLWGADLSACRDAVVVLYGVTRGEAGNIESIDFNFVAREEFDKTYSCL